MYSTPKYKANIVKVSTSIEATRARLSIQKTKWESTRSIQKNHLPKSTKEYVPLYNVTYNSFKDKNKTNEKDKIEP